MVANLGLTVRSLAFTVILSRGERFWMSTCFSHSFANVVESIFDSSAQWPAHGTPYPTASWPLSPTAPSSAQSWSYGNYPVAGTPVWGPPAQPAWGAYTPQTPNSYPTGYPSAYVNPPQSQPHPPTPYFTGQPPPGTPYEPASAHPTGWYDGQQQQQQQQSGYVVTRKKKKRDNYGYEGNIGHSQSMKRSNSQGRSPRRPPLQRSASWGNPSGVSIPTYNIPAYARGDLYDENNLARRPRDWRADFTGREGIASYIPQMLPQMLKPKSDVIEWSDPGRREIHPLLIYRPTYPPIYYDLREEPFAPEVVEFLTLDRPHNDIDFAQLACQPGFAFLRLFHPRLPWYIDVHQSHPNGVTIFDIFSQMTAQLHTPIHGRHYWNEALSATDRECRMNTHLIPNGVLQVDFLGDKSVFQGLSRGPRGLKPEGSPPFRGRFPSPGRMTKPRNR
ncbi:hypothetical protein BDZ97DRAFT_1833170 [Flammula alnicola]|nr:hypothetical protein BDZ97DRAFT_1833170 [Flammula alnicola]